MILYLILAYYLISYAALIYAICKMLFTEYNKAILCEISQLEREKAKLLNKLRRLRKLNKKRKLKQMSEALQTM